MKSMNLVETCKVLCSNSFWIEFVWWIADSEEENCDGFIMVLGGRKPVLNLLNALFIETHLTLDLTQEHGSQFYAQIVGKPTNM